MELNSQPQAEAHQPQRHGGNLSYAQFTALMEAINQVRSDLTERLDRIEGRLREVEVFQAEKEALAKAGQEATTALRWKLGIVVSVTSIVTAIVLQLLKIGG